MCVLECLFLLCWTGCVLLCLFLVYVCFNMFPVLVFLFKYAFCQKYLLFITCLFWYVSCFSTCFNIFVLVLVQHVCFIVFVSLCWTVFVLLCLFVVLVCLFKYVSCFSTCLFAYVFNTMFKVLVCFSMFPVLVLVQHVCVSTCSTWSF
jgi:hypothetical protein